MRRMILAVVLVAATLSVTSPQASANTPNCVSNNEMSKVQVNWRRGKVHRVFDITGRNVDSYREGSWDYRAKEYRHCRANTTAFVLYRRPIRTYGPWRVIFLGSSTSSA